MPLQNSLKIIIIILSLILLIAIVGIVYLFFFSADTQDGRDDSGTIIIEPKAGPAPVPLSQEKALAPTVDASAQKVKYYSRKNGNLYEVNFDGTNLTRASSAELANVFQIIWSPDANKVVGAFEEEGTIKKYLHDYSKGQSVLLNTKIKQVVWSPDGNKIVSHALNPEDNSSVISIANVDGTDFKNIFQTRIKDIDLAWPTSDKVSIKTKPSGLTEGLMLVVNPESGEFYRALGGTYGMDAKWFPLGNKILYSSTDTSGRNIQLFTVDQKGENRQAVGVSTLIEKCVIGEDNRTLFCAIPKTISVNAIWPDDYYKGAATTIDDFWKINLDTGEKNLLWESGSSGKSYDATNILLSPDEDYLFFINKKDGLLYGLRID